MYITPENVESAILIATSIKISSDEENDKSMFLSSLDIDTKSLVYMNQTHSSNVALIDDTNKSLYDFENKKPIADTDAIITNIVGLPLLVRTADCLPVVLYAKDKKAVAVIHAGWRGIVSKIIPKTIELISSSYLLKPSKLHAYLGARISVDDYEVGDEVACLFTQKKFCNSSWYVDIGREAREQIISAGLKKENIEDSKLYTFNDERFYSYRRDKNKSGRIFTVAMIKK